jgi:hypothetical protein
MSIEQAIEKIAELEKRIAELEKRQSVVINNWPLVPAPIQPVIIPNTPYWPPLTQPYCGDPPGHSTCLTGVQGRS